MQDEYLQPTFSLQTLTGNDKKSDMEGWRVGRIDGGRKRERKRKRPSRDVSVTEYFCKYLAGKHCWHTKIQHKCGVVAAVLHKTYFIKETERETEGARDGESDRKRGG